MMADIWSEKWLVSYVNHIITVSLINVCSDDFECPDNFIRIQESMDKSVFANKKFIFDTYPDAIAFITTEYSDKCEDK